MRRCVFALAWVLVASLLCCVHIEGYETVSVVAPSSLALSFSNLRHTSAYFGSPNYETSQTFTAAYLEPTEGCSDFNKTEVAEACGSNCVLLIDRGDTSTCTFVAKTYHAERAGARAVIIVNAPNRPLAYMKYDNSGRNVSIPAVMVTADDGDAIQNAVLEANHTNPVQVRITWNITATQAHPTVDVWLSTNDDDSASFLATFATPHALLNAAYRFTPWFTIQPSGSLSGAAYCFGRYCTNQPLLNASNQYDPLPVLRETLRQICLHELVQSSPPGSGDGSMVQWWQYATAFSTVCRGDGSPYHFNDACSIEQMRAAGFADSVVSQVNACVAQMNQARSNTIIPQFENQFSNATALSHRGIIGLTTAPVVLINSEPYRGSLSCALPVQLQRCSVLQAVCAGFDANSKPALCNPANPCPLGQVADECGVCNGNNACQASTISGTAVGAIVAVLIVVVVAGVIVWRRRHKQQVQLDLDHILAQYAHIDPVAASSMRSEKGQGPLAERHPDDPMPLEQDRDALLG